MKTCTKCGGEKTEGEFAKDKSLKTGISSTCKTCHNNFLKEWRDRNKDRRREYDKKYKKNHKDAVKANNKKYRDSHKDSIRESNKKYYRAHPDFGIKSRLGYQLKMKIGEEPPTELVEIKFLIIKTKRLCKTLKS